MSNVRAVQVKLPDFRLPGADWADCFEIHVAGRVLTAMEAARLTLGTMPGWIRLLVQIRNLFASLVGLKKGADRSLAAETRIGIFPLISQSESTVVLGLDDWHLDFRLVVDVEGDGAGGTRLRSMTLVRRKNLFGKLYIGVITPFHRLIVPAVLRSAL